MEAGSKRSLAWVVNIILGIGDVEDAGLGRAVFKLQENRARRGGVLELLTADLQRVFGLNDFFLGSWRLLFFFRLFRSFILRWLLLGKAQIHSQEKQNGGPEKENYR